MLRLSASLLTLAHGVDLSALKSRPVSKVIKLLEDMQKQLESEAVEDKKTYDKMRCWCKETKAETAASIQEADGCISESQSKQEDASGKIAALTQEIANLEKTIKENTQQLEEATEMRKKELASFSDAEKELVASISGLKSAITVLSKHNSLLQTGYTAEMATVGASLALTLDKFVTSHAEQITPTQKHTLEAFIQQPTFAAYGSQSGEIFGILNSMLDTFTQDLEESRKGEAAAVEAFSKLKASKQKMIKADSASLKKKKVQKGENVAAKANAEASEADCKDAKAKAEELLATANQSCAESDTEYEERTKARQEELEAVAKALEFLDSDEAHDLFSRALGFTQLKLHNKLQEAATLLNKAGAEFKNPQMLVLAQKIKKGVFQDVIRAVDELVKEIKGTMASDVARRDECTSSINEQKKQLTSLNTEISNNEAKKERLEKAIENLVAELETLATEIAELQKSLKDAGAEREQANADFQTEVKDQQASVTILKKALQVLTKVYGAKLLQQPADFKKYEKSAGGNKVLSMIESIIADAEKEIALMIQGENESQKAYEKVVRDSNESIDSKRAQTDQKNIEKAENEEKLQQTTETLDTQNAERETKEKTLASWEADCKFLFDNFDIRQEHMSGEIEALQAAKAFLQGMK